MRKCLLGGVSILLLLPLMTSGCRPRIYRTYGFEPTETRSSSGTRVEVQIDGSSRAADSAGVDIDVTGNPYTLRFYVDSNQGNTVDMIDTSIRGLTSGTSVVPDLSAPRRLSDGVTLYTEAKDILLEHEDQVVEFTLRTTVGDSIKQDTLRVVLKKTFDARTVSFGEWLSRL